MNINKQIGVHQCSTKDLGSFSSSFFELQSFYSSSSPPHESCAHPHLPAILLEEDEETRHLKVGPPILSSDDSLILSSFTPSKNTYVPTHHKNDGEFDQSSDTLQSLVQSCCCGNILTVQENSIRSLSGNNIQECKHQNNKPIVISDSSRNLSPCSLLSFNKNNTNTENYHQCSKSHLEKQQQQPIVSFGGTTTLKFGSIKVVSGKETKKKIKNKTRIKWTEELDKKFIESVDRLGGARKATPKEILKLMKCDGLTIFHVKSHLQKYRCGQHISQATEGNAEQLDSKTGVEIVEALRLQMDVQRSLYEQLESQKKLQMRIEEQAKQLQNMIKCQLNTK